jgi:hypothetical protein
LAETAPQNRPLGYARVSANGQTLAIRARRRNGGACPPHANGS